MDVFTLATRLVTTGEDQTAAALKRVEGIGTAAAGNITAAWSGVTFDPATRSAAAFAEVSGNLAAQTRLATSAAEQQVAGIQNLGAALNRIDATQLNAVSQEMSALQQRITALQGVKLPDGKVSGFASVAVAELGVLQRQLLQTQAGFVQMGGSLGPAGQALEGVGGKSTKLASIFEKLQKVLFIVGSSSAGLPPKFSKIGFALLSLGAGGAVVAAVTVGMALIGSAMQKAADKAQKESQRIDAAVQAWQQRIDDMSGRTQRVLIEDLTASVEKLGKALEVARLQQALVTQGALPTAPVAAKAAADVKAAEDALADAQRRVAKARAAPATGPGAETTLTAERSAYETLLQSYEKGAGIEATRAASLAALQSEQTKLTTQLAATNLPLTEQIRLNGLLTAVETSLAAVQSKRIDTLVHGAALDATRSASLAGLAKEETVLEGQLGRTNLPLEERIRLTGLLVQVQTILGDLPQTDEQRAAETDRLRTSYEGYLGVLKEAVGFAPTREQALAKEADEIGRLQTILAAGNLELAEEVRLRRILTELQTSQTEGRTATRQEAQGEKNKAGLAQALGGDLQGDLATINANTMAMIAAMGPKLTEAGTKAFAGVTEVFANAPLELATLLGEGISTAFSGDFSKAGDVILAGLGSILVTMGKALIVHGVIMAKLLPHLLNPFTSGPAAIAAGVALAALGTALGATASGRGGSSGGGGGGGGGPSFNGYQGHDERVVRIIVNPPSGTTAAPALTPAAPMNFTIIGPADPLAQRAISQLVTAARARGLPA